MPTIIHLADAHIGAAYDNLPEAVAEECRQAQMRCLENVISRAVNSNIDAILIAGDLFDMPTPPLSLADQVFTILSQAACPVLIAPGNHDYLHPGSPYVTQHLPDNIHVFQDSRLEAYTLADGSLVWGAAFTDMSAMIPLDVVPDPRQCNILLVHADLLANTAYNPLTREQLQSSGFTYAAVGHNHAYTGIRHAGYTSYASPGCLMGRGLHEPDKRGYLCGTVTVSSVHMDFCSAGGVDFLALTQSMQDIVNDAALSRAISMLIPENHAHACASLTLTGERTYAVNLMALREALAKIFLYAEVHDESILFRDPWRYLAVDDLRGAVTRRFHKQIERASSQAVRDQALYALRVALAALEGEGLPPVPIHAQEEPEPEPETEPVIADEPVVSSQNDFADLQ